MFAPFPLIHTETPGKYLVQTWMSAKIRKNVGECIVWDMTLVPDGRECVSISSEAINVDVPQGTQTLIQIFVWI